MSSYQRALSVFGYESKKLKGTTILLSLVRDTDSSSDMPIFDLQ